MNRHYKIIAFILIAIVSLFGTTGCLKTSTKIKNGNATGKVFDSNGKALHKAQVMVYGTANITETDEYGKYTLNNISTGQAKLVATYENNSVIKIVEIKRGETLENVDITFSATDKIPPVMLSVTASNITGNSAEISWNTNEKATSIVDYATGPVGLNSYNKVVTDTGMTTNHKLTLENLLSGQVYHFRVRGVDADKNEGISSDYQFTTLKGDAPAAPASFAVAIYSEQERLSLTWQSNTEDDIAGYYIYRSNIPDDNFNKIATVASNTTSYLDEGLSVATKYYYKLSAYDTAGNESLLCDTISAVTPGILTENRTWSKKNSPYIIQGDIRVRANYTLTIEPGVEIRFTQTDAMPDSQGATTTALIIQGALKAIGTEKEPITFTSAEPSPRIGCWDGIYFVSTNDTNNIIKYVSVIFAEAGIKSTDSAPIIEYCTFSSCGAGLELGLSTALNIRYNIIQDCNVGLFSSGSNIRNNLFTGNQTGAILMGSDDFEYNTMDDLIGVQVNMGSPVIKNNIIARVSSTAGGIYGISQKDSTATPQISYNNLYNYTTNFNEVTTATETGNILTDPQFTGGYPYSYVLKSGSPALTADENGKELGYYHKDTESE